jgi:glycosyltransferase involved in cell wall biosynthesis
MNKAVQSVPASLVSIIIPAYKEAQAIGPIVGRIRAVMQEARFPYEIIVVNDGSEDETAQAAKDAGAKVVSHPYNIGNGAAVKTGIRHAAGDSIVLLDADGQHPPEDIPRLLDLLGTYDMVVGARTSKSQTSWHRDVANYIYNTLATYVSGRKIEDLTSGFRAIKTEVARNFINLLPNTFSYPTTITLAVIRSGYSLKYIPFVAPERIGKSKIKLLRDGSRFLLIILRVSTLFSPMKIFLPLSLLMFLTGFGYGLFKVVFLGSRYGPTSAMLMTVAILMFMMGLVSEQVAQLRFERAQSSLIYSESEPD